MNPVIKPDGTVHHPVRTHGRGRQPKHPWGYLEVGDYFVANSDDLASVTSMISTGRVFGVHHEVERGVEPFTHFVKRTA